tara:strand:+ start:36937 stop:37200 length:264 start_codon:yes stop_codon:yes gene_type:complete
MKKLYGLQVLKDKESYWSGSYLFSHDIDKLKKAAVLPKDVIGWKVRSKVERNCTEKNTVTYTINYNLEEMPEEEGPYYKIVEVAFII